MVNDLIALEADMRREAEEWLGHPTQGGKYGMLIRFADRLSAALTAQGETHSYETGRVSGLQEAAKIAAAYWHSDPAWNSERIAAAIEERASATPVRPADSPSDGWRYMRGLSPRSPTPDPGESALTAQGETVEPVALDECAHDYRLMFFCKCGSRYLAPLLEAAQGETAPAPVDQLLAPCKWCGYNGPNYWQPGTHAPSCRWFTVGGEVARRAALAASPVPAAEPSEDAAGRCRSTRFTARQVFPPPVVAEGLDVETLARETADKLVDNEELLVWREQRRSFYRAVILAALRAVAEARR